MKFQILIELLYMLLARKKVTAKQVADRFDISLRTAYRYFRDIELANVPLLVDRGKEGGYYIADTFKMPGSFLTEKELNTLSTLLNAVSNDYNRTELDHIEDKLIAAAKTEGNYDLSSSSLIIDGGDWFNTQSYKNKLALISQCIVEHVCLEITYHDRTGEITQRTIEPHALVLKQGLWYAYCYCRLREQFRMFKIGRIELAVKSDKFCARPFEKADAMGHWKTAKVDDFVFEISPTIKSDVEEWLGIENVRTLPNGKIIAECSLPVDKGIIFAIMKYGSDLKVIKPNAIKKQIKDEVKKMLNLYNKD